MSKFEEINKLQVLKKSLLNKLNRCTNVDEQLMVLDDVQNINNKLLIFKCKSLVSLEKERSDIIQQIAISEQYLNSLRSRKEQLDKYIEWSARRILNSDIKI